MRRYEPSGAMPPRKRRSAAEQEPNPVESTRKQGPSTPPGKQREERRAEWKTQRRQVRTRPRLVCPRTIGVGIDPGVTQAVSAASGVWDPATGQLVADQLAGWKLTKGQAKHASGLNNARRATERWLAPIKPHLQHLAAASSAGTSLVANLKHITVTLATWDAVWEVYLDLKWAQQRLRLYGAENRTLEQYFKKASSEPGVACDMPNRVPPCQPPCVCLVCMAAAGGGHGGGVHEASWACQAAGGLLWSSWHRQQGWLGC
ncbi:uncharacterized protein HaLaN_10779 [Haematococcus lacustris]|uniref:RRXRR domain-containing protein n=1 Tax=Haematococcus lacustris TaxID=44745 RepID=A0A699YWP8_HAELA|nr:uncharacterized protein HaLaN_10779 [Haematococcus lacustris]